MKKIIINDYFDELEFWDTACFGQHILKKEKLIIPVRQVVVYKDHPLNENEGNIILPECNLIFIKPKKSIRFVSEYVDTQNYKGFHPSYTINDLFSQVDEVTETFILEGTLENPPAWITWEIESVSFALELSISIEINRDTAR